MITVTCDSCGATAATADHADPDGALACGCCPRDHHHGRAAAACPGHDGPHGPAVPGCTVCRPVTITMSALLSGEAT